MNIRTVHGAIPQGREFWIRQLRTQPKSTGLMHFDIYVPVNEGNAMQTESRSLERQSRGKLFEKWISRLDLAQVGPMISEVEIRDAL